MCKTFTCTVLLIGMIMAGSGCRPDDKGKTPAAAGHKSPHGGVLNVIEACGIGHVEVKLEGDTLKCWFVGGESDTASAVRVPDRQITLTVTLQGGPEKTLTLDAKPNELAEEKAGNCSQFEGNANWLAKATKFQAAGTVNFKGKARPIRIEYPEGYDPDEPTEKSGGTPK